MLSSVNTQNITGHLSNKFRSLIPFDVDHKIVESIAKTNRVIFIDEDVPGGATAYMMQKVLEEQKHIST